MLVHIWCSVTLLPLYFVSYPDFLCAVFVFVCLFFFFKISTWRRHNVDTYSFRNCGHDHIYSTTNQYLWCINLTLTLNVNHLRPFISNPRCMPHFQFHNCLFSASWIARPFGFRLCLFFDYLWLFFFIALFVFNTQFQAYGFSWLLFLINFLILLLPWYICLLLTLVLQREGLLKFP